MGVSPRVLVVDDDQDICDATTDCLKGRGYEVTATTSATAALREVKAGDFDAVLTDIGMTEMDGLHLCERIHGARPDVPVIIVTGQGSLDMAIGALRSGAYDFITKPIDADLLAHSVARAVQHRQLSAEVKRLRQAVTIGSQLANVIGNSAVMTKIHELVMRLEQSDASVLIQGETGTGKERIAQAIHANSRRQDKPFVALNCAAVPQPLLESELFGHAKGAFTGATQRGGIFRQAHGGTLFLDEIGDLPIEMQPKLLRALQERTFRPVGADTEVPFDVRIITATNRDLEFEVFQKRFREDLYYRINVVKIDLPPLRHRAGDVLLLAQHFLLKFAKSAEKPPLILSPSAAEKLVAYGWPGNVRELENCMERAVALAQFDHLTVEDLPDKIRAYRPDKFVVSADDPTEVVALAEVEQRYINRVITLVGGNKAHAAQILGIDRRTLYRKLERLETTPPPGPPTSG